MSEPAYRRVTEQDARAVAEAGARIWDELGEKSGLPGRMTAEGVLGRLSEWAGKGAMFVCESGGRVCGFAAVQQAPSTGSGQAPSTSSGQASPPSEAVMGVWVLPEARGKRIGTELAVMATEFAREAGYKKLRGTIPEGNEQALSFFGEVASLVQVVGAGMEYELPL